MKLSNRKSYMTSLEEGRAPSSIKSRITQFIYFAALSILAIYLIYIFIQKFYYFSEVGFIEVNKITISSARGGRIASLKVAEGEHLEKGAVIAVIKNHQNCIVKEDSRIEKLKYDIEADKLLMSSLKLQIQQNKISDSTDKLYRALELEKSILAKTNIADKDNLALLNEVKFLVKQLTLKRKRLKLLMNKSAAPFVEECYDETIAAPFSATVYSMQKQTFEVITRSESILVIVPDVASVLIEVYLDIEEHPSVKLGDRLEVELPGGIISTGIVESILSSAYDSPDRKWKGYMPVTPHLRLHLKPENEQQTNVWKSYDQMEVKVGGKK